MPRLENKDAIRNLRAVAAEYLVLDERIDENTLFKLIIDAVTKPTDEQPLIVQMHVEGTRANRLSKTPSNAFTEDDEAFWDGVEDFRG